MIDNLIEELNRLPDNKTRNEYLASIQKDELLERHSLKRIACNVLIDDDFINQYYKEDLTSKLKKTFKWIKVKLWKYLFLQIYLKK